MKYFVTSEQMKAADARMIHEVGIPSLVLMERAALQFVQGMEEEQVNLTNPLIVCGSGNNGGDGFAIARLLLEKGISADVVFVGNDHSRTEETKTQMEILQRLGGTIQRTLEKKDYSCVIDAVFGVGLSRPIEGNYKDIIALMNACPGTKVAVDTPSGVCQNTGNILGIAFCADLTITFAYGKVGQFLFPGADYTGKVLIKEIGIKNPEYETVPEVVCALEKDDILSWMPDKKTDSNKGTFGKVLLIVGSEGMAGAACLCGKAAYRIGAGLVQIYTEESNRVILQQQLPEAIISTYSKETDIQTQMMKLLDWADVTCIGCGLGVGPLSEKLVRIFLEKNQGKAVLDADALNLIAKNHLLDQLSGKPYIITPHMKEMERLSGVSVAELKQDKMGHLRTFVESCRVTCVMKDSRTVTLAEGRKCCLNISGNQALAKGGTGDVLAGVITGILAQTDQCYEAAALGAYLHGLAGDRLRDRQGVYGLLALELADEMGKVLKEYKG